LQSTFSAETITMYSLEIYCILVKCTNKRFDLFYQQNAKYILRETAFKISAVFFSFFFLSRTHTRARATHTHTHTHTHVRARVNKNLYTESTEKILYQKLLYSAATANHKRNYKFKYSGHYMKNIVSKQIFIIIIPS